MADMREAARKAWRTRRYNEIKDLSMEEYEEYLQYENDKEQAKRMKTFRSLVLQMGGVWDSDYESVPLWAKRQDGNTLDILVDEVTHEGYPVEDASALYALIQDASPGRWEV